MKTKISKLLIALLVITLSTVYASNHTGVNSTQTEVKQFTRMSTMELQEEVERLASEDKLPFEMGLELMKRWQTKETNNIL